MEAATAPAVAAFHVTKKFPGVIANENVTFDVRVGEVHALLGENGAGKTTLSNILTGLYRPDDGWMEVAGVPVDFQSPRDAIAAGIGMVHQHFRLIPTFSVAENIALGTGHDPVGGRFDLKAIEERVAEISESFDLPVDPRAKIWQLSVGEQQRVEIIKVLYRDARVLIFDEPTAVLSPLESERLGETLQAMARNGRSIVFISHKLGEVASIADRVTVLRHGRSVETTSEKDVSVLASLMIGRDVKSVKRSAGAIVESSSRVGSVVLEIKNLHAVGDRGLKALEGVSLNVRSGEIVGVAGVAGNGQRELVEILAGLRRSGSGLICVDGESLENGSTRHPIRLGVSYVPQDRMGTGLAPDLTIAENMALKNFRRPPFARPPFIRQTVIDAQGRDLMEQFDVRAPSETTPTRRLSGGNVQKVLLAREMSGDPKVLVIASPSQGLDVGAVATVHQLLIDAAESGVGVLLVSEDLDEVLALSNRIAVMYEGRILETFDRADADAQRIGMLMGGQLDVPA